MASDGDELKLDDLTEIYRVEKKSGSLMTVRSDLYKAIAALLKKNREEYDRILGEDPDSLWLEGVNARRKKALSTSKDIVDMRMAKICKMALRGAMGAENSFESLTPEEKEYYDRILAATKSHRNLLDNLSGKARYVNTDITQAPIPKPIPVPVPEEEPVEEYYEPEDDIPVPEEESVPPAPVAESIEEGSTPLEAVPGAGEFEFEEPDIEEPIPEDELDRMENVEKPLESAVSTESVDPDSELVLVRILQDLDTFAGLGGTTYTLRRENVVHLPAIFANVLIKGNMAVKITPSP